MTEPTDTPSTPEPAAPAAPAPAAPAPKSEDLPDWARDKLSKANTEAANYRVQLRTVETERDSLAEKLATLEAQAAQAATSASEKQHDFDRLVTAVQALTPDPTPLFTFANTLQGDSEEALKTHAESLKTLFGLKNGPVAAVDRSQGLGTEAPSNDPAVAFTALMKSQLQK
ncbi:scaffolding protein [Mycobacterium phage PattyP]|uniref:Scaffolding protein n=4 Tax=Fromanvirus TaxID=186764 RepID=A0A8F3E6S6_9CAUD|nr:scaffolding protein [Mycobacterium phage PattyP]YP_009636741.1 scaffolding protein [Mycobacterium phage JC27]YP_009637264.1 scaffolding protein [Mycobacterium phage Museum]YP_009637544.1 scaffold protein [Mycobacterium phage BPBiebs31]AVJ50395.1 scaffolding protein [Mycobacterium phage MPlant7149]AXH43613.1 scaffolding protein [Mycobacterium phage BigMau]AXH44962.1 scaffolding protein [Mycobacterium phage Rohr]QDB74164.1 scaffolding protein [Mycobacterium phage HermioneGrange]QNJ56583.1 